ncbi:protein mono-ADP-ribosyltransferase TIPARP-like [Phycodurus eques]|uniref:protein mono-ADP-ribosyltransferase TIPARP-like n=1 Tax=Phycodurus eques TaxID=693459 RepID=UPI002ACE8635|nr:protein mono-ADP-ribosyltransferase TIPARP-like [Phycodurus eques]XP_061523568.1 protein mono-ADP-ribosyltransferase TIPARP-like [Phycodurus eques]
MKRKMSPDLGSSQDAPRPSFVLLQMPVVSAELLPPEVDVTWTVTPYCLSAHLTPRGGAGGPNCFAAHNSCLMLTAPRLPQPLPAAQDPVLPPVPSVYTWSSHHVDICDRFLLGMCRGPDLCKMHHTLFPFHWQLYSNVARRWVDIRPRAQLLLERMYCNVDRETVTLKDRYASFDLLLDDMEIVDTYRYSSVRRLRNSESRLLNPHFPSEWRIYWWNNNGWEEYDKAVSALLLQKMSAKEVECSFMAGSQEYKVNFITMKQSNVASGFEREVRCRPVYRPLESLRPHLKTVVQTEPIQHAHHPNFNTDPLEDFTTWYPPIWCLTLEQDCCVIDVPAGTRAFLAVQKLFYDSLSETKVDVIVIQQVQNFLHWDKYQRHKVYMQKKHVGSGERLERHLFHGTTRKAIDDICHNNFDPRVAGTNGSLLGYGSYFATSASVSHLYTDETPPHQLRHMFLAKVLVGKVTKGEPNYRRPPPNGSETCFYDACVDCVSDPNMFVVFDSCQCYPYYLIKYKDLNAAVEI